MNAGRKLKFVGLFTAMAMFGAANCSRQRGRLACVVVMLALVGVLLSSAPALASGPRWSPQSRDRVTQLPAGAVHRHRWAHGDLDPWQGRKVSVLVEAGVARDRLVMTKLVRALDRAWDYYARTTGRLPATAHSLNGRDEVAEVTSTCGAGCTYIGATGTEMLTSYFESMYQQIAQYNLYDQIPFYELGRSFWFWSPQLQFQSPDQDPSSPALRCGCAFAR